MSLDNRVSAENLSINCNANIFDFNTTDEVPPLDSVIGQARAVDAIEFCLNMKTQGYNLFVTGEEGTGKSTILKSILKKHAAKEDTPKDICLVYNFEDAFCPIPIYLPSGTAIAFKRKMANFIGALKIQIPRAFENTAFQKQNKKIQKQYIEDKNILFKEVETFSASIDIGIGQTEQGYKPMPIQDGKPMEQDIYDSLSEDKQNVIMKNMELVQEKLNENLKKISLLDKKMQENFKTLISGKVQQIVSSRITALTTFSDKIASVKKYLETVREDIVENMAIFMGHQGGSGAIAGNKKVEEITLSILKRYQINVMVCHRKKTGAPVIFEPNPNFANLFGIIEKNFVIGGATTDFTMIQAGSLLKANQGYLILEIAPLVANPLVWETVNIRVTHS